MQCSVSRLVLGLAPVLGRYSGVSVCGITIFPLSAFHRETYYTIVVRVRDRCVTGGSVSYDEQVDY